MESLAARLISRGDALSIEQGRLSIHTASGKAVPSEWMDASARDICRSVLMATGIDAYEYIGHRTGHYGKHRAAGLTLFFASVITGEAAHAIFNVDLTRKRTTAGGKAGDPLPAGQFRVGERSHFYKFWLGTGLQLPDRMQRFHKCMGKLSDILLTGTLTNDRFDVQSIGPVSMGQDQVRLAVLGHNSGTTKAQVGHKKGTSIGHKQTAASHESRCLQANSTTCVANHENKLIRKGDNKTASPTDLPNPKPPQDQTVDEWLGAYDSLDDDSVVI